MGNQLDFGARMYDPRIGKFLSIDPHLKSNVGGYNGFCNNPLYIIDPSGMDGVPSKNKKTGTATMTASFTFVNDGSLTADQFAKAKAATIENLNTVFNGTNKFDGMEVKGAFTVTPDYKGTSPTGEKFQTGVNYVVLGSGIFSSANKIGGNIAYLNPSDLGAGDNTAAHEVLHLFGLSDRYSFFNTLGTSHGDYSVRQKGSPLSFTGGTTGSHQAYKGGQTIPVSINPKIDEEYYGQENLNIMFNSNNSGVTTYQWRIMFSSKIEPNWGGNNIYLGNTGVFQCPTRAYDLPWQKVAGPALTVSNKGEIGYWIMDKQKSAQFVVVPTIMGWYNPSSKKGDKEGIRIYNSKPNPGNKQIMDDIRHNLDSGGRGGQ